ncbi:hypothetical protein ACRAKI_19695 [Saccharothrix isguenensis]
MHVIDDYSHVIAPILPDCPVRKLVTLAGADQADQISFPAELIVQVHWQSHPVRPRRERLTDLRTAKRLEQRNAETMQGIHTIGAQCRSQSNAKWRK